MLMVTRLSLELQGEDDGKFVRRYSGYVQSQSRHAMTKVNMHFILPITGFGRPGDNLAGFHQKCGSL
ncbi:hypothetical protein RHGRI_009716 [Rhododendron griersonianum]|uniref:Uncharacterized protein n=1 Tax=Rhododendron griersonianum TaxID=479676 RepID=A0AAV6KGI9_9ERIC|nr:hypothetical protein RHGRI_009716 [Rhododendron griersonianum]